MPGRTQVSQNSKSSMHILQSSVNLEQLPSSVGEYAEARCRPLGSGTNQRSDAVHSRDATKTPHTQMEQDCEPPKMRSDTDFRCALAKPQRNRNPSSPAACSLSAALSPLSNDGGD